MKKVITKANTLEARHWYNIVWIEWTKLILCQGTSNDGIRIKWKERKKISHFKKSNLLFRIWKRWLFEFCAEDNFYPTFQCSRFSVYTVNTTHVSQNLIHETNLLIQKKNNNIIYVIIYETKKWSQ